MAIQWGTTVTVGSNQFALGVDVSATPTSATPAFYGWSRYEVASGSTLTRTGASVGTSTHQINHGSSGGTTYLGSWAASGAAGQTLNFGGSWRLNYNGANPSVTVAVTLPVAAPSAPSTPSVTRVSDTSHTLSWSLNSSPSAPYSWVQVQRRESVGTAPGWGQWATVATLAATATTFTDTSTKANRAYQWRIGVGNSSGTATSPSSAITFTTPATPVGASVAAPSGIDHVISWTRGTLFIETTDRIEVSTDGGATWTQLASVPGSSVAACSWTNPSPTQGPAYRYRVRTVTASNSLASGYATTGTVATLAPPNPPTVTLPVGPVNRASAVTASWVHNSVDTTSQTAYELRYRLNGGAWTTLAGTTAESRAIPAQGVSGTLEVQVQTRGAHASFSPWSSSRTVTLAARPTVAINSPTSPWPSARATVEWGFFAADDGTQVAVEVELRDYEGNGARMGPLWTGTTQSSIRLSAASRALENDREYEVRARVRSSTGLWSTWESVRFVTSFLPPTTPTISVEWDRENGATILDIFNPPAPDEVPQLIPVGDGFYFDQ